MRRLNFHSLSNRFWRRPELHPARALLTATWLVALAVLALNDHVLKGAGVLPGALTGKLSDFAGMIVAPVLLAVLLRVRSRRGLLACHAAVGAVFAGINLSPELAAAWSQLMGLVWPWHITVDPTDLVAIPALALGWRALVPAMTRPAPALAPWLPAAGQASAVAIGGFFCVATSEGEGDRSTWQGDDTLRASVATADNPISGFYAHFTERTVTAAVGVSYSDLAHARMNLDAESPRGDFDAARRAWMRQKPAAPSSTSLG